MFEFSFLKPLKDLSPMIYPLIVVWRIYRSWKPLLASVSQTDTVTIIDIKVGKGAAFDLQVIQTL